MTANLPAWFLKRQESAKKRFEETPSPKRTDEQWRYGNIKQLNFVSGEVTPASEIDDEALIKKSVGVEKPAAKFVFVDDRLIHSEKNFGGKEICLPLAEALEKHSDLLEKHFMKQETKLGSAKFTALHEASVTDGLFIFVPKNEVVEGLIEIHHWNTSGATTFPHTLIVTEESAQVRVADIFRSTTDDKPGVTIACNDLAAGKNSALDYVAIQAVNEVSRYISVNETTTARDARAKSFILNVGAAWSRNETLSLLEGPGAHSDMLSVSIPHNEQEYDQRTFQHHLSEGAYSDLLYKNTLYGHSKTVFSGLIYVGEKAHHTDAYQTCRNLMMTDDCEANSMPGLEIYADQVKCSHGSTSARISDEEIFYLQARGIDAVRARQLIARGFSVQSIERLENDEVEELILRFVDEKFACIAQG